MRRTTGCRGLSFRELDYQKYLMEYLAQLSGAPLSGVKQVLAPFTVIQWTNLSDYQAQVKAAIGSQRSAIAGILENLQTAGLLEPGEITALQLEIVIDQEDQRKAGAALPDLLPVPVSADAPTARRPDRQVVAQ